MRVVPSENLSISAQKTAILSFATGLSIVFLYSALFAHIYASRIVVDWGYFGFKFEPKSATDLAVAFFCIFGIYVLAARKFRNAADFVVWLLFVLAYIPIQITIALSGTIAGGSWAVSVALFCSFGLSILVQSWLTSFSWTPKDLRKSVDYSNKAKDRRFNRGVRVTIFCGVLFSTILSARFYSIMRFAGLESIYEQRAAASEYGAGPIFGYLILWLTYLVAPVLLAVSLSLRRYGLLTLVCIFLLVVFSINAAKVTVIIVVFSISIFILNRFLLRDRLFLIALIPLFPLLSSELLRALPSNELTGVVGSTVEIMVIRGVAIQAMIFNLYAEFFAFNPYTYYSHVSGVSLFIDYPYDLPIGRVIGLYQYGNPDINANSGIWATDGIAALGETGVVFVGLLFGLFLGFCNRMLVDIDPEFTMIALVPLGVLMVNASLFTSLFSGGGFFLVFIVRALGRNLPRKIVSSES